MAVRKNVFRKSIAKNILFLAAIVLFGWSNTSDVYAAGCKNSFNSTVPVPPNFGAAHNQFSAEKELLIYGSQCDESSFHLQIGSGTDNQYIYKKAYFFEDHSWKPMYLEGDAPKAGNWFQGSAEMLVDAPDLAAEKVAVGFVCQYISGSWKCGCHDEACVTPYWQIQKVSLVTGTPNSENQTEITIRNQMTLAGKHTFRSPSGKNANWKVDRLTSDEEYYNILPERETGVFTASGSTATFDLTKEHGQETVYEITTSENGVITTYSVQVFRAGEISPYTYKSKGNPDITVYLVVPPTLNPETHLISVHHGNGQYADSMLSSWTKWASANDYIGVAPEFPYPEWSNEGYNEGNLFPGASGTGKLNDKSKWSFTIANNIALKVLTDFGLKDKQYDIFGHSAGGRFTHRFMMFMPDAPIRFAFPANPGLWTLPSLDILFPHGLKNPQFSYTQKDLLDWTNRKIIIIRGMDDVVRDFGLDITPKGDAQGPNRFVRAKYAYDMAKAVNPSLAWELIDVPNCPHSDVCTSAAAQKYLEEHSAK